MVYKLVIKKIGDVTYVAYIVGIKTENQQLHSSNLI